MYLVYSLTESRIPDLVPTSVTLIDLERIEDRYFTFSCWMRRI